MIDYNYQFYLKRQSPLQCGFLCKSLLCELWVRSVNFTEKTFIFEKRHLESKRNFAGNEKVRVPFSPNAAMKKLKTVKMKLPFQQNVKKTFCFKPQVCVCYEDEGVLPNTVIQNMKLLIQNSRIS